MATTPTAQVPGPDPDAAVADPQRTIAALRQEHDAALAREAALAEVLKTISASPDDTQPVFDLIACRARELCAAQAVTVHEYDGTLLHLRAMDGYSPEALAGLRQAFPRPAGRETMPGRVVLAGQVCHIHDVQADPEIFQSGRALGIRSGFGVPLLRDGRVIGTILLARFEVKAFDASEVALVESFAEQAVIAIASATTLGELRQRTADLQESLEYQTATSDVLKVISRSTFDLQPVLDTLVETAARLCDAEMAMIGRREGELWRLSASFGYPPEYDAFEKTHGATPINPDSPSVSWRTIREGRPVHIHDVAAVPFYPDASISLARQRTTLGVPLLREGETIGIIVLARQRIEPFTDHQIELISTFADQAVIALENVRLLTEQREALEQQTATAEVLQVINASPGNLVPVFDAMLEKAMRLCGAAFGSLYIYDGERFQSAAQRGVPPAYAEFRAKNPPVARPGSGIARILETKRPDQVLDLMTSEHYRIGTPNARAMVDLGGIRTLLSVPLFKDEALLGYLAIYRQEVRAFSDKQIALLENFAAQAVIAMENARLLGELRTARDTAEAALADLRRTQDRLVQSEKMASLGQLTAGIAHEIKNPLNFVNNFSDLSVDLLDELHDAVAPEKLDIAASLRAEIDDLTTTLKSNLKKIAEHGRRADSIVKNMLLHSRSGTSERRAVDLNATAEEALSLAYHGARAETPGFNITMEKELDPTVGMVELFPQEFARVLVNLINNGFYAAHKRAGQGAEPGFEPTLRLSTRGLGDQVEIRVRDNGTGIQAEVRDKIFEPFFTTKPAGEGTGLGLSLSYDIVVKQHGGQLSVDSEPRNFTEFTITLPRQMLANEGGRA